MSIKTHTGIIITNDGEKRVKLRETPTTWCVGPKETYRKEDGSVVVGHHFPAVASF